MAYRSTLGPLLGSHILLAGSLLAPSGCGDEPCPLDGCSSSYELELESMEPTLATGLWHLSLQVDGSAVEADCMVSGPDSITCDVDEWTDAPNRQREVTVSVGNQIDPGSGEPTDTGVVPERGNQALFVTVTTLDQMSPVSVLDVTAQHEGVTVLETQRTPTYEPDDFASCGACSYTMERLELP